LGRGFDALDLAAAVFAGDLRLPKIFIAWEIASFSSIEANYSDRFATMRLPFSIPSPDAH
jgi:hypothetical protein